MGDVGNMTHGLRDNAKDLIDIWTEQPVRRGEFGYREVDDIKEAVLGLLSIIRDLERHTNG